MKGKAGKKKLESLGYTPNQKDFEKIFERFKKLADTKKSIYDEDIVALLEDQMVRVPETWSLHHFSLKTETGEKPKVEMQIKEKGKIKKSTSSGDGPVDACYRAIDKITKVQASLTQYAIQAVTPGEDALGEVTVRVRVQNREIMGHGSSTDVIEASVKAYLNALNRAKSSRLSKQTVRPPGRLI